MLHQLFRVGSGTVTTLRATDMLHQLFRVGSGTVATLRATYMLHQLFRVGSGTVATLRATDMLHQLEYATLQQRRIDSTLILKYKIDLYIVYKQIK